MKALHILLATFFVYNVSQAQGVSYSASADSAPLPPSTKEVIKGQKMQRGMLKGPEAKNHPDWQYRSSRVLVSQPNTLERVTGPAAKNAQPWQSDIEKNMVPAVKKPRPNLKGPRAKNYRPYRY